MPYSQHTDGLGELQRELGLLPDEILDRGERIVGKAMSNIKSGAVRRVREDRPAHLPHMARSYSYDVTRNGRVITGEAGADTTKLQGGLDVYYTYGTDHSAPHDHWWASFDEELPRFDRYAEDYLAELVE